MNAEQTETLARRLIAWHQENSVPNEYGGGYSTAGTLVESVCLLIPDAVAIGEPITVDDVPTVHAVCVGTVFSVELDMPNGPTVITLRSRALDGSGVFVTYTLTASRGIGGYPTRWDFRLANTPLFEEAEDEGNVVASRLAGRIAVNPARFDPNEEVGRALAAQLGWVGTQEIPPIAKS